MQTNLYQKVNHLKLILVAALFLLLTGCTAATPVASPSSSDSSAEVVSTQMPLTFDFENAPEGSPADWTTLYAPFSTDSLTPDFNKVNIQKGHFLLENLGKRSGLYELYQAEVANPDIQISLDALVEDSGSAIVDLVCRYSNNNWYQFSVSNNSSAIQWVQLKGDIYDVKVLVDGPGIDIDGANHRLGAVCNGTRLSLMVDGVEHLNVEANFLSMGGFGFGVESTDSLQSRKAFDNIVVQPLTNNALIAETVSKTTPSPMPVLTSTVTSTPVLLPSSTLRPTPIPADQLVIYNTDFNDGDTSIQDWSSFAYSMISDKLSTEGYQVFASNGIYRFKPTEMNQRIFSIYQPDLGTSDVSLSIKGAPVNNSGNIGLVCRYSEAGWYQFMEENSGQWSIRMAKYDADGKLHFYVLSKGNFWFGSNTELGAECKGDTLSILIDGDVIASLHDDTFPQGKVGLLGWSFTQPALEGWITQFTVKHTEWSTSSFTGPAATPGADGSIYYTDFKNLNDLSPYWVKIDAGIQSVPGDAMLIGPGSKYSMHAFRYINDFDPGQDVEISADLNSFSQEARGLICRYSEDGWYQLQYWKVPAVTLVRMQRDQSGFLTSQILGSYTMPELNTHFNLSLKCVEDHIYAGIDGKTVLSVRDNAYSSGKFGLFFIENLPGNVTRFFKNYLVQPAKILPQETLDITSREGLIATWGLENGDPRVVQENGTIFLNADSPINLRMHDQFENSETSIDLDFLAESQIVFRCREGEKDFGEFDVFSNGNWSIFVHGKILANGNSASIKGEGNKVTFRCWDNLLTLTVNGETLASTEFQPGYIPYTGINLMTFEAGSQVRVRDITLTYVPQKMTATQSVRSNQVVLLPEYQPGETIYPWDINAFVRFRFDPKLSLITRDAPPVEEAGQVVIVKPVQNVAWEYQPELLDLPVEISAKTAFDGKLGSLGLMCRSNSIGRYEFLIQPDGKWLIRRNTNYWFDQSFANITIIAQGTSDAIQPGENKLDAVCRGNELIFSDNGVELGRVTDDYFPEGKVGILFTSSVSGRFSDFNVMRAKDE